MKKVHVAAAVILHEGRVLATQRSDGDRKGKWEFPGGKCEPGESPEETVVREIREELDARIRVSKKLCTLEYDYPKFHLSMECFLCALEDGTGVTLREHQAARWLSGEELDTVDWLDADRELLIQLAKDLDL